eukprot:COSAG06_NODE_11310_length_1530_cov_2.847659_3_plen_63_part_00
MVGNMPAREPLAARSTRPRVDFQWMDRSVFSTMQMPPAADASSTTPTPGSRARVEAESDGND